MKKKELKLYLRFQSFRKESLKKFKTTIAILAKVKKFGFSSIDLPLERKKLTILKSPHVNKKAKDQFEFRFYNALIVLKLYSIDPSLLEKIHSRVPADLLLKLSYKNSIC